MFDELPETKPVHNKKKPKAIVAAAAIHFVLVSAIILAQMAMPQKLGQLGLLTTLYMAPPPPPPAALGPSPEAIRGVKKTAPAKTESTEAAIIREPRPVADERQLIAPTVIPKDIERLGEVGASPSSAVVGAPGGVPGGVPGGAAGGILGGVLGGTPNLPPPPPPPEPVRVGGNVRQPRVLKLVQPHYPPEAVHARVEGVVVLEATVTERGTVEKVKVISGPQLLVNAAIEAVQSWRYEPTILNGTPVPVILTAKVNFSLANSPK